MTIKNFLLITATLWAASASLAGEHAGKEHAGKEHAGEKKETKAAKEHAGKEHAGKEHAGDEKAAKEKKKFTAEEVAEAVKAHVEKKTKEDGGVFKIADPQNDSAVLELQFVKTHPVRFLKDGGYFDCTDFAVKGSKEKIYDLDFWLYPKDGKLKVTKTMIHKHPKKDKDKWVKQARYTFNDKDEMVSVEK